MVRVNKKSGGAGGDPGGVFRGRGSGAGGVGPGGPSGGRGGLAISPPLFFFPLPSPTQPHTFHTRRRATTDRQRRLHAPRGSLTGRLLVWWVWWWSKNARDCSGRAGWAGGGSRKINGVGGGVGGTGARVRERPVGAASREATGVRARGRGVAGRGAGRWRGARGRSGRRGGCGGAGGRARRAAAAGPYFERAGPGGRRRAGRSAQGGWCGQPHPDLPSKRERERPSSVQRPARSVERNEAEDVCGERIGWVREEWGWSECVGLGVYLSGRPS
jgi:hypothetical protein